MLHGQLPEKVEPVALARAGARLRGELSLGCMPRLAEYLVDTAGKADVALEFGTDEYGVRFIKGRVSATLRVQCQRCLQPMTVALDPEVRVGLAVSEEAAAHLPRTYEPLVAGMEPVVLAQLVEDELILALPIAPMHEPGTCSAGQVEKQGQPDAPDAAELDGENPFHVLAGLKKHLDR